MLSSNWNKKDIKTMKYHVCNWIDEVGDNKIFRGIEMKEVMKQVMDMLSASKLSFSEKPVLIGGRAMEYYEMRKSGEDIDLVITDNDYQKLAEKYPDQRKDLYGDLGLVIGDFEIWRSIWRQLRR